MTYLVEPRRGATSGRRSGPPSRSRDLLIQRLPMTVELTIYALTLRDDRRGHCSGSISAVRRNSAVDVVTMGFANLGVSIPVFVLGLAARLRLRDRPEGHARSRLPPSGRLSPGVDRAPGDDAGTWRASRDRSARSSTSSPTCTRSTRCCPAQWGIFWRRPPAHDPAGGRARHDPARDHRPDHPLEPARRARASTTSGRPGRRASSERTVVRRHGAAQRDAAGRHDHRAPGRGAPVGRGADRDDLQPGRRRARRSTRRSPSHDFAVIQGFTLVIAIGFLVVNLLVDISYAYLDPRVRLA